jgi:hypothetical protein
MRRERGRSTMPSSGACATLIPGISILAVRNALGYTPTPAAAKFLFEGTIRADDPAGVIDPERLAIGVVEGKTEEGSTQRISTRTSICRRYAPARSVRAHGRRTRNEQELLNTREIESWGDQAGEP